MISAQKPKPYVLGLSIGTLWLLTVSAGYAIAAILGIANFRVAIVGILVMAGIPMAMSGRQMMAALKLPSKPRTAEGRRIRRQFILIVVAEGVAIALVSVACDHNGYRSLLVPLILIIAGIHFLPLAKLFGVPRYTTLGLLFCTVSILTLLLVPAHARIGTTPARFVYSALGCAASAWLIAIGSLLELRRLLQMKTNTA